ncbi:hypothetical protein OVS_03535 [Mycoplasma ovis str. Michigan]|uniref:Uncharacterized protein n=1 Tax=Mycoplasma ovis str. Michigan TaxID=1415773 RepID=A0ABN4BN78_9MOLU|nr:hypothetical protein [Mycoplasma ovis]AHC40456.1 hypothetical protein OVS_03535 [Mycoplasma ovis str. Michigan]
MEITLQEPLRMPQTAKTRTIQFDDWEKKSGKTKNLPNLIGKDLTTDCKIESGNTLKCTSGYTFFITYHFDAWSSWIEK